MITNENIQKLKETVSIIDLVSKFVQIHKQGSNYMCVCPFHSDKNPSMVIREDEGYFHCFGCGAHGDAISFIQKYKNIDFIQALNELASMYNFTLDDSKRKLIRHNEALTVLNEYYINELNYRHDLLQYLEKRKITRDLRIKFNIGYAPSANDTIKILQKNEISNDNALMQGVLKKNENGLYPSFIDRITFPIYDNTGFLVGFGGRTLNPNNPAKYVNSPASRLFDKSSLFYGYHLAKNEINKNKKMIICEGYMDTISFHKAGFTYAVAVLGTALTANHLKLIKKDCFVMLCFDKDNAGQNAAFKAASLLSENGYNGEVITLKSYKDPGEFIENNEISKLKDEMNNSKNIISFCIEYIFKNQLNLEYIDKLSISKIEPYLIKKAYANILNYTNKLDTFLASTHIKIFCDNLGIDYNLLNGIKIQETKTYNNDKKEQNKFLEGILYFLASSKDDFKILLKKEYFDSELLNLILERDYSNPKIIKFMNETHINQKITNIIGFFTNLAKYYASCNILNSVLFKNYAIELVKNPKLIYSEEGITKAYLVLIDLLYYRNTKLDETTKENLKNKIKNLGV
ncbi:DNA primase [Campylobacter sp. MG1]|uniref:DNA primase n=1 Tax=Campylobacter sp. MG1 TaxID=2976332 RepID=UPI00226D18BF|nr:DNA primase [Campylobacter sp. MG1]